MLTSKVSYGENTNIGNVNISIRNVVGIVLLTCIQLKQKVVRKTDSVRFVNSCTFNTILALLI